jgi:probable rRNA maturation factor
MTSSAPRPRRTVGIRNAHPRLRVPRAAVRRAIAVLDGHADRFQGGCPPGELSLAFLTDPALAQVHADFMDDPTATDVITFEAEPASGLAGEVCVSVDTARAYARRHRQPFATELTLYLVHGWLHLAGYDDLQPARKRRMRAAERRALALLRAARAVPGFLLV